MGTKWNIFRKSVNGIFAGFIHESDVLHDAEAYDLERFEKTVSGRLPNGDWLQYDLV